MKTIYKRVTEEEKTKFIWWNTEHLTITMQPSSICQRKKGDRERERLGGREGNTRGRVNKCKTEARDAIQVLEMPIRYWKNEEEKRPDWECQISNK